jgi:hypothetical protein
MNVTDYFDWWLFSGTGLGTASPGETLKQLRQELSRAGADVVTVSKFLEQCPDVIDVGRWRRTQVWGLEGVQMDITAAALEAIGARGAAAAVRQGGRPRPAKQAEGPSERRAAPPHAGTDPREQFLKLFPGAPGGGSLPEMINDLRERIVARFPEMAASMPEPLRARPPQPRQTEGAETREEITRLLEDYVSAHRDKLAGDVAEHGDPRQAPGFDRERALEDRARQSKLLYFFRVQRGEVPLLREKLEKLRQRIGTEAPDSVRVQRECQRVMEEYRTYAKHDPEELTAEVREWLAEVDRLREQHPEVFRPRATRNEELHAKLTAIGEYRATFTDESRTVRWASPRGLECDWTRYALVFYLFVSKRERDPALIDAAYEQLLGKWEEFRDRFPELEPELKEYVLELFRKVSADQLGAEERADYEDDDGEISDEKILANVEGASVNLVHHDGGVEVTVHFGARWDEEHGVEVQFDENGEILRWF